MPIVVEQFVLELDTTVKVGGGVCFTIGGTRQVPIIVQTAFNQISQSAGYKQDDVSVNLTVCGGSNGGVKQRRLLTDHIGKAPVQETGRSVKSWLLKNQRI